MDRSSVSSWETTLSISMSITEGMNDESSLDEFMQWEGGDFFEELMDGSVVGNFEGLEVG